MLAENALRAIVLGVPAIDINFGLENAHVIKGTSAS